MPLTTIHLYNNHANQSKVLIYTHHNTPKAKQPFQNQIGTIIMWVWEVSKSNISVFSKCGHKANNYLEKGPYCISLRQITLVLKEEIM